MKPQKSTFSTIAYCFSHLLFFMVLQGIILSAFAIFCPASLKTKPNFALLIFNLVYLSFVLRFYKIGKGNIVLHLGIVQTHPISCLLAFLAGFLFSFGWDAISLALSHGVVSSSAQRQNEMLFAMGVPMAILVAVFFQPITEEILFRGVLMRSIFPQAPRAGLLVSAALFAFMHLPAGGALLPVTFFGGLLFGYLLQKSRSILPPILAHMGANAGGVLGYFSLQPLSLPLLAGIGTLLLAVGVIFLFVNNMQPVAPPPTT